MVPVAKEKKAEIDELGDLSRLKLLLENVPDEALMRELESARGQGRISL